jgi:hypothetical protein
MIDNFKLQGIRITYRAKTPSTRRKILGSSNADHHDTPARPRRIMAMFDADRRDPSRYVLVVNLGWKSG